MKNIFEVNQEEKSRILNLHESATKNQYLSEEAELFGNNKKMRQRGEELVNAVTVFYKKYDKNSNFLGLSQDKNLEGIANEFRNVYNDFNNMGNPDKKTFKKIGEFFSNNQDKKNYLVQLMKNKGFSDVERYITF